MDPAHITTDAWWGGTAFVKPPDGKEQGKMVKYILEDVPKLDDEGKKQMESVIVAVSAEAALPAQHQADEKDEFIIEAGRKAFGDSGLVCTDCHEFRGEGSGTGPDLTGWASRAWTIDFIKNPAHKRFYGRRNDRMPAYGERGELTDREIELVTDWLRGDMDRH
jgi:ubiquinol-cytochrome c reductase cytochrome b subunit